jgi:hypothetical protein
MLTLIILCVLLLIIISMWVMGFAVILLATFYFYFKDVYKPVTIMKGVKV